MKNNFCFNIDSILYGFDNFKGPIDQVLFAKNMAEREGTHFFNRLARVSFTDNTINKEFPGAVPLDETLILGYEILGELTLHLCIRSGRKACRIATGYFPSKEICLHEEYRHVIILRKLSVKEIRDIFTYVWDNTDVIFPKMFPITPNNKF